MYIVYAWFSSFISLYCLLLFTSFHVLLYVFTCCKISLHTLYMLFSIIASFPFYLGFGCIWGWWVTTQPQFFTLDIIFIASLFRPVSPCPNSGLATEYSVRSGLVAEYNVGSGLVAEYRLSYNSVILAEFRY